MGKDLLFKQSSVRPWRKCCDQQTDVPMQWVVQEDALGARPRFMIYFFFKQEISMTPPLWSWGSPCEEAFRTGKASARYLLKMLCVGLEQSTPYLLRYCPDIAVLEPSQKSWWSTTLPIPSFWLEGAELFLVSHLRGTRTGLAVLGGHKLSGLALCCPLYLQMQVSLHHPILQPTPLSHIPLSSSITKTNSQNGKEHERTWKMTMEGKTLIIVPFTE